MKFTVQDVVSVVIVIVIASSIFCFGLYRGYDLNGDDDKVVDINIPDSETSQITTPIEYSLKIKHRTMTLTAYCPCERCCGDWADGITASGHKIMAGDKFVAAPKDLPFGTVLDVPEYGKVEVLDRGGAIKENRLDLFFDTHQKALNFGIRRNVEVIIYQEMNSS